MLLGESLLQELLTPAELTSFQSSGHVFVETDYGRYDITADSLYFQHPPLGVNLRYSTTFLCVIFKGLYLPPLDHLIMKYLLVKGNPQQIWNVAAISGRCPDRFLHERSEYQRLHESEY